MIISQNIPKNLVVRFTHTEIYMRFQANIDDLRRESTAPITFIVEYMRDLDGCLEVWAFRTTTQDARPEEHFHITVHPDKSEQIITIGFRIAGPDHIKTEWIYPKDLTFS